MGTGREELKIKATLEGGKQTADGLKDIAGAQAAVNTGNQEAAQPVKEATAAQEDLNASESDYIQLLTQISPVLGRFVDAAIKGSKVAGDLATQNINLTGAFKKAKAAITANAGALKLLTAGGAAVVGLVLISKAFTAIKKEAEEATKAINGTIEAQTRLRNEAIDRKQSIEDIADARREGGFNAGEARQASDKARLIGEANPSLQDGAVNQALALGGVERSVEELSKIAFLLQSGKINLDGGQRSETRDRVIERALERNAEVIDKAFAREDVQAKETRDEAKTQAKSASGGNLAELIKIIEPFIKGTDLNPEDIAKIIQVLPAVDENRGKPLKGVPITSFFANTERSRVEGELGAAGLDTSGVGAPSQVAINVARKVLNELRDKPAPITIVNNNQGATLNGSDAASRQQREAASGIGENASVLAEN